jgi:hypothetical protein
LKIDISQKVNCFSKCSTPHDCSGRAFWRLSSRGGVIGQHRAPGDPRNRFGLGNCHRAAVVVSSTKCSLG